MLARPFFKAESNDYFIKGLRGDDFLRVATHDDYRDELERVEAFIKGV